MTPFSPTGAEAELRRRIEQCGTITFAEFMDVALYWPGGGYYAGRRALGPGGDFYTAPLAHPVFGALIACQLHTAWRALGRPRRFVVVEAGAGDGRLAADIGRHAPALDPAFARALDYTAVDRRGPPPDHRGRWLRDAGLPTSTAPGVVLANELLDAMPVHRVTVRDGRLRELFVTLDADGRFADAAGEPSTPALAERLAALGVRLPEGCRAEVGLAVGPWLMRAYAAVGRGYLLLIDYGHEAPDYYDEARRHGTLRCYAGHAVHADPYARPGRHDISVHVELTSLRAAASAAGFAEAGSMSQRELLTGLGLDDHRSAIRGRTDVHPAVRAANLRLVDSLADPAGMGAFRVLAFAKDAPRAGVLGIAGPRGPAPLSTPAHLPLGLPPDVEAPPTWEELLR